MFLDKYLQRRHIKSRERSFRLGTVRDLDTLDAKPPTNSRPASSRLPQHKNGTKLPSRLDEGSAEVCPSTRGNQFHLSLDDFHRPQGVMTPQYEAELTKRIYQANPSEDPWEKTWSQTLLCERLVSVVYRYGPAIASRPCCSDLHTGVWSFVLASRVVVVSVMWWFIYGV